MPSNFGFLCKCFIFSPALYLIPAGLSFNLSNGPQRSNVSLLSSIKAAALSGKHYLRKSCWRWATPGNMLYSQVRGKGASSDQYWLLRRHSVVWNAAELNGALRMCLPLCLDPEIWAFIFLSTNRIYQLPPPGGSVDSITCRWVREQGCFSHKLTALAFHGSKCQNSTIVAVFHVKLDLPCNRPTGSF